MNAIHGSIPHATLTEAEALDFVASRAAKADAGEAGLAAEMAALHQCGVLDRLCFESGACPPVTLLRRIGRASLSVGRLAEGHMNALALIRLYGSDWQRQRHLAAAQQGTLYGVWGADDDPPLRIDGTAGPACRLSGGKRFASGLGVVHRAVVTAQTPEGPQLLIADVADEARADARAWNTSGMRATASGRYDFGGATAEPLGAVGDYLKEPHFEGGVWRYAALHVGGLEALAEEVRQAVGAFGEKASEPQLHRVARLASLAHVARLAVEDAARQVSAPHAGGAAVAASLAARETVERACQDGMALADRALGTRSFATGYRAELVRRDLAFFLRQADLDQKLRSVGQTLCEASQPVGEVWS